VRALVVGGAGFLGSHVVDRLLAEGSTVDVLDDLSSGSLSNLAEARAEHTHAVKIHNVDVRLPEVRDLVARLQPDAVVHLATGRGGADARAGVDQRLLGSVNLLDAAAGAGVGKIVVALPAAELYGRLGARELPAKEGTAGPPLGHASVTARAVVDFLGVYREQRELEFTALAVASVYGPRQRAGQGVVAAFLQAAQLGKPATIHGDGRQTRDFVYVDDAVDAVVRAMTRGGGLVVNVGTGKQTAVRDLHALVVGDEGAAPEFVPAFAGSVARFAASPVRARIHLSWAPWTSLADGVAATRRALT
jgi:UDP-glucose 4-epimerase